MTFQVSRPTKPLIAVITYMLERAPVDRYAVPTMTDVASKTRSGLEAVQILSTVEQAASLLVKAGHSVEVSKSGLALTTLLELASIVAD